MLQEVPIAPPSEQHANQFITLSHAAAGLMHNQISNSNHHHHQEVQQSSSSSSSSSSSVLPNASGAFLPMDLHLAQGYSFFASSHNARKEVLEEFLGSNPQHIEGHSGILEMRKEKSRDAARSRRGKENYEFYELAKMLPLPPAITSQLDKASIIRLTISFLRLKEFSSNGDPPWIKDNPRSASLGTGSPSSGQGSTAASSGSAASASSSSSSGKISKGRSRGHQQQNSQHQMHHQQQQPLHQLIPNHGLPVNDAQLELFDQHQGTHILQSLDGFAFSLGSDGRFLYISETVSIYLGLSQVEMTGSSVFDYVHTGDHNELAQQLGLTLASNQSQNSSGSSSSQQQLPPSPASGTGSMEDGSSSMNPDVTSLMSLESNAAYQGLDRCFCIRMKSTLTKRGCHFKSSGYRVVMVLCRLRPLSQQYLSRKSAGPNGNQPIPLLGMIAMAIALPPPTVHEVRLEPDMFVTRLAFDFRIIHCEPRIAELLEFTPEDLTGRSLYTLCHAEDVRLLRKAHTDLMHKSQVMTPYYRILNKNGGFTWLQSCATVVCNSKNNDEQSIVCVNYILSRTEMKNLIVDECQLDTSHSSVPSKTYKMESSLPDGIRGSPEECNSECTDNGSDKPAQVPEQHHTNTASADGDAEVERSDERNGRPASTRLGARTSKRKYDEVAPIQEGRDVDNTPRSVDSNPTRPDSPSIRNPEAPDQSADIGRWKRPYEMESDTIQERDIDGVNATNTDFSTNALLSNGKQRSTIQWIGTPSLAGPSMQLLRQLYASRESVIRANVHAAAAAAAAGRPSGPYFTGDPSVANAGVPGEFNEAFPSNPAHSYQVSATTASSFLTDYLPAMTPPSSVSPRDAAGVLFAAEASLRHSAYSGLAGSDPSYSSASNQLKSHHHLPYGAGTVEHHHPGHHHHTPPVPHQYANVQPLVSTPDTAQFYSHPTSGFHIYPSQIPNKAGSPSSNGNSSVTWFPN